MLSPKEYHRQKRILPRSSLSVLLDHSKKTRDSQRKQLIDESLQGLGEGRVIGGHVGSTTSSAPIRTDYLLDYCSDQQSDSCCDFFDTPPRVVKVETAFLCSAPGQSRVSYVIDDSQESPQPLSLKYPSDPAEGPAHEDKPGRKDENSEQPPSVKSLVSQFERLTAKEEEMRRIDSVLQRRASQLKRWEMKTTEQPVGRVRSETTIEGSPSERESVGRSEKSTAREHNDNSRERQQSPNLSSDNPQRAGPSEPKAPVTLTGRMFENSGRVRKSDSMNHPSSRYDSKGNRKPVIQARKFRFSTLV